MSYEDLLQVRSELSQRADEQDLHTIQLSHTIFTVDVSEALASAESRSTRGDELASNRGKRIGILIVTYNAVTTLSKVLKRIPANVWSNVEEIVIFDDASQDATYELAVGLKALSSDDQ